jgi:predicted acyltransferase (DUF342 family)
MSQITTKWIADSAITPAKVDPTGIYFVHGIDSTHANFLAASIGILSIDAASIASAVVTNLNANDATVSNSLKAGNLLVSSGGNDTTFTGNDIIFGRDGISYIRSTKPAARLDNLVDGTLITSYTNDYFTVGVPFSVASGALTTLQVSDITSSAGIQVLSVSDFQKTVSIVDMTSSSGIRVGQDAIIGNTLSAETVVVSSGGNDMTLTGNDLIFSRDGQCYIKGTGGSSSFLYMVMDQTTVGYFMPDRFELEKKFVGVDATLSGGIELTHNLLVLGDSSFSGPVRFSDDVNTYNGNISANSGDIYASTDIEAGSSLTAGTYLIVGTDATVVNDLRVGMDASVVNDLWVGGDASFANTIQVNPGMDATARIGKLALGDVAGLYLPGISNINCSSSTEYALLQTSDGTTVLNSSKNITLRNNNLEVAAVNADGLKLYHQTNDPPPPENGGSTILLFVSDSGDLIARKQSGATIYDSTLSVSWAIH